MHTVFLSDVNLEPERTDITTQFMQFLDTGLDNVERLFIVGDLFEAWIGDDAPGDLGTQVIAKLAELSNRGIAGYFTHGNRDFLVGETFAETSGFTLLGDEEIIDCYGQNVLLMHGDSLCTDDVDYQALRHMVRNPEWQKNILSLDVQERLALAKQMRQASADGMANKTADIMDVNQTAVNQVMDRHEVSVLLHGHTHRPDVHTFEHDGQVRHRIVLGDWYTQGSIVEWTEKGYQLKTLER